MSSHGGWRGLTTPANIVTFSRILFIPVFVILMLAPWARWMPDPPLAVLLKPWLAAVVFTMLAATDGVDGYLARSRGEVTTFGKFLDPLADKLLVAAALLALVDLGSLPAWVALVILARDFLVSGLRMVAASQGKVIAASPLGKVKTVFQIIAVAMFIVKDSLAGFLAEHFGRLLFYLTNGLAWTVMAIALLLTVISLIDYFTKSSRVLGFVADDDEAAVGGLVSDDVALAAQVLEIAKRQGVTMSCAESCTGGLIAAALTAAPGASAAFKGGIVAYDNSVKLSLLAVDNGILEADGAVSEACVRQMAIGARELLVADVAVATSGIAGPDGGSYSKPTGTVWLAVAWPGGVEATCMHFSGNRAAVRQAAVAAALGMVRKALENDDLG
ncbi:MAG: CDP-diacylglycerol--glycerol-3-phosphate 3-phosphatidyltransferase [Actinomycetia bacterium]|nr:CDP-diacylglycerol--glycerol-3-phosphate 3-phosphatidyltransferase [Actinomycetes bacterium]